LRQTLHQLRGPDGKLLLPSSGQQVTEWVYGVTTGSGSTLNSNDLVKEVRYPDATTGASSSTDKDTITVNALGQKLTVTDRNGNTHSYSYDTLARQTADAVTTLGSGVDGAVRRIVTAYDGQGNANLVTRYGFLGARDRYWKRGVKFRHGQVW